MNTVNPYLKQYQKNQIETATPEQVLILLYDGAIQYLIKATMGLEEKNNQKFYNNIVSAQRIILEFMDTLDMEIGGELAKNLYRLYEYLYDTLGKANIKRDQKQVDEVLKHLKSLRETWQKAISIANSEKNTQMHEREESVDKYNDYGAEDDEDEDDE